MDDNKRRHDIYERTQNAQEKRVLQALSNVIPTVGGFCGCTLCWQDAYALSLNRLPAAYRQKGTVALSRPEPSPDEVAEVVRKALEAVMEHPNHS
jgi:hypothetical protein